MNESRCSDLPDTSRNCRDKPADDDHANVNFPPPLIHGAGVFSGVALATLFPLTVPSTAWILWLGAGLMVAALLIAGWAFREFGLHRNPVPPNQAVNRLMISGPFCFTRNPLYLALALMHAGLGLISNNVWLLLTLAPSLLIVRYYVITREEAYLTRRFGAAYRDYQARVRRWF